MNPNAAFPAVPDYGAHWVAVYWEPIFASGERITILVAARDEARHYVQETVPEATWTCFLGRQAGSARRMVKLVADSLRRHLDGGGRLSNWAPPLTGISASEERFARAYDIGQIVRTALTNTSAFAALPDALDFPEDAPAEDEGPTADRWPAQVQSVVVARAPTLEQYFQRKIELRRDMRPHLIDYAGRRYCANYAKLIPDTRMGYWLGRAKIKLADLEQVRAHAMQGDALFGENASLPAFELVTYRPSEDDPGYTDRAMSNLAKALAQLEDFADSHSMRLVVAQQPEQAATRLIQHELAA